MTLPTQKYTGQLRGKRILIFGGTSGIGFAVAEAATEHGAVVTLVGSQPAKMDRALQKLRETYPSMATPETLKGHICDLSKRDKLEANIHNAMAVAAGESRLHHIAYLAANPVVPPALSDLTVDSIQEFGVLRYVAPLLIAKILPKYMDLTPANSLTLTSAALTQKPDPGWTVGVGYWGAIEAVTRGLALDLKPLRVNCIAPGAVLTDMVRSVLGDAYDAVVDIAKAKSTINACGKPENVAQAYLYVMQDQYISGSVVQSNGGMLLL